MQRVVDLELWSLPRAPLLDGKAVALSCRSATTLKAEIILGLSFTPDETDTKNLGLVFAENPSLELTFDNFCREQALPSEPSNTTSAARFFAFWEGQPLAWLHFPAEHVGKGMALSVYHWAVNSGYVIRSAQGEPSLSEAEIKALWES